MNNLGMGNEFADVDMNQLLNNNMFMKAPQVEEYEDIMTIAKKHIAANGPAVSSKIKKTFVVVDKQEPYIEPKEIILNEELRVKQEEPFNLLQFMIEHGEWVNTAQGTRKLANTVNNCSLILNNDPLLKDSIKLNLLSHQIEVVKPLPWEWVNKFTIRGWEDADDSGLRMHFENYKMYNISKVLSDAFNIFIKNNAYHPIKQYLDTLKWDGVKRIDNVLQDLFEIEHNTENDLYYAEAMKVFLIGGVERIYRPGSKFDYMPIIYGNQGIRKSTFFKMLAIKQEWYLEDLRDIGKSGIEQIQGKWVVEWAELNAMYTVKEVAAIKNFVTTSNDTLRVPYEKRVTSFPRQCIFGGTTNEERFLHDKTGNRRYLPIKAGVAKGNHIDTEYFASIVDQLWAEAKVLFEEGYVPMLSKAAEDIAYGKQSEVVDEDPLNGIVEEFVNNGKWGSEAVTEVCTKMLFDKLLSNGNNKMTRNDSVNLSRIMNNMEGWELYNGSKDHVKRVGEYGKQLCWVKITN